MCGVCGCGDGDHHHHHEHEHSHGTYAHVGSFDRKMRALRSRPGAGQWVGALQKLRLYSR